MNPDPASSPPKSPRWPKIGEVVQYRGQPAKVTQIYPAGASWVPSKFMPVDLEAVGSTTGLAPAYSMVGYGPNVGWSWPDEAAENTQQASERD